MTKKEIIKIIQEEEARLWKQQEYYRTHLDTDLFYREYKATKKLYKRYSSEWIAISVLMDKLDIKSIK
jgi:hypothetical protein